MSPNRSVFFEIRDRRKSPDFFQIRDWNVLRVKTPRHKNLLSYFLDHPCICRIFIGSAFRMVYFTGRVGSVGCATPWLRSTGRQTYFNYIDTVQRLVWRYTTLHNKTWCLIDTNTDRWTRLCSYITHLDKTEWACRVLTADWATTVSGQQQQHATATTSTCVKTSNEHAHQFWLQQQQQQQRTEVR